MVKRITFPFLVLLVLLGSCEQQVAFEVPQPEGKQDERMVPAKLLGTYISDHDSTKLTIYPRVIVKSAMGYDTAFVSELDSADRQTFKSGTSNSLRFVILCLTCPVEIFFGSSKGITSSIGGSRTADGTYFG